MFQYFKAGENWAKIGFNSSTLALEFYILDKSQRFFEPLSLTQIEGTTEYNMYKIEGQTPPLFLVHYRQFRKLTEGNTPRLFQIGNEAGWKPIEFDLEANSETSNNQLNLWLNSLPIKLRAEEQNQGGPQDELRTTTTSRHSQNNRHDTAAAASSNSAPTELLGEDKIEELKRTAAKENSGDNRRTNLNSHAPQNVLSQFKLSSVVKKNYAYGAGKSSRMHAFSAKPLLGMVAFSSGNNRKFSKLSGDGLKRCILEDIASGLSKTTNMNDLREKIRKFERSDNYKILKQTQGLVSSVYNGFFGCCLRYKSSSEKAWIALRNEALETMNRATPEASARRF